MQCGSQKCTVLIVDDHPHNLIALEAVLGTSNYNIVTAVSGPDAMEKLFQHEVAVILLDVQMPGMDGYEVAKRVKADPRTAHIPIILVTAIFREEAHVLRGYESGAVDYFSKPYNIDILRTKVAMYTDLYRNAQLLDRFEKERARHEQEIQELRRRLEAQLERRETELEAVLSGYPDAVYVGTATGITSCNAAALKLFGFSSLESWNQHFQETLQEPFVRALSGERSAEQVEVIAHADGTEKTAECLASPIVVQGIVVGAVAVNICVPRERDTGGLPLYARETAPSPSTTTP